MAQVPEVDFSQFVARKKEGHVGGGDGHDYAYISDRQTRAAFQKMAPVEYAVAATVRLFKAVGKNQLLGSTVRVTERQFPRLHALNVQSAQTLGIATPSLYVGQNPHLNAGTFGTNDDSFILVNGSLIDHFNDKEILDVLGPRARPHPEQPRRLSDHALLPHQRGQRVRRAGSPTRPASRSWPGLAAPRSPAIAPASWW